MRMPSRGRLLLLGVAGAGLLFALQGGQYSTLDLLRHRSRKVELEAAIDSLERQVDSLTKYRKAVLTDPVVQERIARELWGMVKENEIIYRIGEPGKK